MNKKIHKLKLLAFFAATIFLINNNLKDNLFEVKANQNSENKENVSNNETKKLEEIKKIVDSLTQVPEKNVTETKKIEETEKIVNSLISLPTEENKNKPVVILNPGHGFEDPGCTKLDSNKNLIKESYLNQKICYELTLKLLNAGFEVYLVFDLVELKEKGLNLPKNNSSLHILFESRPPKNYKYNSKNLNRMADASAFCIKQIFKKIYENNKEVKIVSICLHHNSANSKEPHGIQPFYCNGSDVSETFKKNGHLLCEIILKNCKHIYNLDKNMNWSKIKTQNWVVCIQGKNFNAGKHAASLLVELGFLTNQNELTQILDTNKQIEMSQAITQSLNEYFAIDKK